MDQSTKVFGSGAQLRTTPSVPIDMDETGKTIPNSKLVWTGTDTGGARNSNRNCIEWSFTSAEGQVGSLDATATWTAYLFRDCSELHSLYCFEQ